MWNPLSSASGHGATEYLPGRQEAIWQPGEHYVLGHPMAPPYPQGYQTAMFGMGCFWGVEKGFWQLQGVYVTAAGYSAGVTPNPTYKEVCSGQTGHNEVVLVVFDPARITYTELLSAFWQGHDPTQGMRQGNDRGSQYRSGIYTFGQQQQEQAIHSLSLYQGALSQAGYGTITTEIRAAEPFYFAEEYHQQYLAKNPHGYCGHGGTGIHFPDVARAQ